MKLFARNIYLPAFLLLLSLGGCIKEDFSDCSASAGVKIYLDYDPATYARTGIDPSEVKRIDVFAFDAQGILRGVWIDKTPVLSPDYYIFIPDLPTERSYRFVIWGGLHECYCTAPTKFEIDKTTFDEVHLLLDHTPDETITEIKPLFHAEKTEYINNAREQRISVPLVQAYNTLNLTTEGLANNTDGYRLTVYDNNGKYKFDHSFADCCDFKYTASCNKDTQGQLSATLNILKLAADRSPVIEIAKQDGTVLYSENLVTLINATAINYDQIHVFDIHLKFGLSVSVSINDWLVVEDGDIILQ